MGWDIKTAIFYFLGVNVIAFIAFGVDKYKAQHNQWRISESTLLTLAAIGGSIGAYAGMRVWHHKTLHNKFRYGIPAIFIIQIIALGWFSAQ